MCRRVCRHVHTLVRLKSDGGTKMRDWVDFRSETLRCPYCETGIDDAWEIDEGDCQDYECPNCGEKFEFSKEVSAVYTTYKIEA